MFNLKPKEDIFFKLFIDAAHNAHKASQALNSLMHNYDKSEEILHGIGVIEKQGDTIKYEIEKKLDETFITPFDREDIYLIAKKIDKYVNSIQTTALRFRMLHINEITQPAKDMAEKLEALTEQLIAITENLQDKKKMRICMEAIAQTNIIESQADEIFRNAITELFEEPTDLLNVIKLKEIYQFLEDTADDCEEIANAIKGVVTKNE